MPEDSYNPSAMHMIAAALFMFGALNLLRGADHLFTVMCLGVALAMVLVASDSVSIELGLDA